MICLKDAHQHVKHLNIDVSNNETHQEQFKDLHHTGYMHLIIYTYANFGMVHLATHRVYFSVLLHLEVSISILTVSCG